MKTVALVPLVLAAALGAVAAAQTPATATPPPVSGIDTRYLDPTVRPQDDFYRYVNGKWLATVADPGRQGRLRRVRRSCATRSRRSCARSSRTCPGTCRPSDPDQQKIADLYASFMDEAALEALGLKPLAAEFARIDGAARTARTCRR